MSSWAEPLSWLYVPRGRLLWIEVAWLWLVIPQALVMGREMESDRPLNSLCPLLFLPSAFCPIWH
ncbi:hypothetical protein HPC62_09465 [Thermoleptolyngbya sichuanensis A183]|uniref:Uncharacterized protein n=1 Tax=Thermoleptolyngbya sichuanensis A183 TaxID=2737172 RepID=A0A6M8B7E9_9CYAN|nr:MULTISPECIES: hypothetical protein [Thermoleptolyngbya]QKD82378.1 hypothetical protein HPC62_09465 [Thermoleptolyngbya sichuanensis A183]